MTRPLDATLLTLAAALEADRAFAFQFDLEELTGAVWRYTSLPEPLTIAGNPHTVANVTLASHAEGGAGTFKFDEFAITADRLEPFLSFAGRQMPFTIQGKVWQVLLDTDGTPYAWLVAEGFCTKVTRTAAGIKATFGPLANWLNKPFPAILFSRRDQRVPYTADFGVDADDFRAVLTVESLDQTTLVYAETEPNGDGWYNQGFIRYDRVVAGVTVPIRIPVLASFAATRTLHLARAPHDLAVDDTFDAFAGYNGNRNQSLTKFNNFRTGAGFLGDPFMPTKTNPVLTPQLDCDPTERLCDEASACPQRTGTQCGNCVTPPAQVRLAIADLELPGQRYASGGGWLQYTYTDPPADWTAVLGTGPFGVADPLQPWAALVGGECAWETNFPGVVTVDRYNAATEGDLLQSATAALYFSAAKIDPVTWRVWVWFNDPLTRRRVTLFWANLDTANKSCRADAGPAANEQTVAGIQTPGINGTATLECVTP